MKKQIGEITIIAVIGLIVALLSVAVYVQTVRVNSCRAEFDAFKVKVESKGEAAKEVNKEKEKANEDTRKRVVTRRNADRKRLRDTAASGGGMPVSPATVAADRGVCFDAAGYNAAHERFASGLERLIPQLRGLAIEGDEAGIDARALIDSWPR